MTNKKYLLVLIIILCIGCSNDSNKIIEDNTTVINNKLISVEEFQIPALSDQIYNGSEITVQFDILYNDETLMKGIDYELKYRNNINVGTATIIIIGKGKYIGEKSITFNIIKSNLTKKPEAVIICQNKTYNGNFQTIATCNGGTIIEATKKNAGNYMIRCSGDNEHADAQTIECVIDAMDLSSATISNVNDQLYTGNAITPRPLVKIENNELVKDIDYSIIYSNNINIGKAMITITGKGNYKGTISTIFQIVENEKLLPAVNKVALKNVAFKDLSKVISINDSITINPTMSPTTATNRNLIWNSSDNSIATVSSTGRVIGRKEGKVTITATAIVKKSGVDDSKVVSSYDIYVCNTPIKSNGEINNSCFGITSKTNNVTVGEQNSKGMTAAITYSLEKSMKNISLKKGKYYFKPLQFSNSGSQKFPCAIFMANITNSSLNLNLGGSTLVIQTNNISRGSIIYIGETSNITITHGTLIGDSKTHKCSDGSLWISNQKCAEMYHGIYVHSATNIKMNDLIMHNLVGDGVYIYGRSDNITIQNSKIYDTGRNSVTATFGNNIFIKDNIFYNNDYGVKIEPISSQYEIDQYPVKNMTIDGNLIYGSVYHVSVYLFRSKNIIVKNNRVSDIISSSYCGETRNENNYNSRCFAGDEKNFVQVSNNNVYIVPNNTTIAPELVNINCIDGAAGCKNSLPWRKVNGNWYYINYTNGTLVRNKWIQGTGEGRGDKKGKWYYVGNDGIRYVAKTAIINGESFTFNKDGICTEGSICN